MGVIKAHLGPAQGDLKRCFLKLWIMRVRRSRDGPRPVARKSTMHISKSLLILPMADLVRPETRARRVRDLTWPGLKNQRVHRASGLAQPNNSCESTALHYVYARVTWTCHLA
eukprot:SAG11_NODE_8450_length_1014_cov_1.356284_1_plen_112_part_01